jgi:hypothetical protein
MPMRGKVFKYVSNIAFALGAVLAAIALYMSFSARALGTCAVNSNLWFIIPAIALLAVAFVTSFFAEKPKRKVSSRDR